MSRIVIILLKYHRHKPIDLIHIDSIVCNLIYYTNWLISERNAITCYMTAKISRVVRQYRNSGSVLATGSEA
jgi:hypothetical protein